MNDAVAMRDRAISMLEAAEATEDAARRSALLHFVVVGANFTGVELAGELFVFLRDAARLYRHVRPEECTLTLLELGDRLLPQLDRELADFAHRDLVRRGVEVRLGTTATEVRRYEIVLADGSVVPTATVIWTAGIAPNPLVERLALPRDPRGYVDCEPTLRVRGYENVWAIGDAAAVPAADGRPYAATAQNAVRMGRHVGRNVARALAGEPPVPFAFRPQGAIAALGCRTGVAKIFGVKLSGFPAWFVFRTAYLLKMPGFSRKVRVALDWTVDLLFRRDVVQLGAHRERPPRTAAPLARPHPDPGAAKRPGAER